MARQSRKTVLNRPCRASWFPLSSRDPLTSVTAIHEPEPERLSGRRRLKLVALAIGLLVPLVVAGFLKADARGFGTHQQLGLPPCTFFVLFGHRCPSCGMTTAWSNLAKGRIGTALRTHVVGTVLGVIDLVAVLWLLAAAWRGRWLDWEPSSQTGAWIATLIAVAMLVEWGLRLLAD